MKPMIIEASGRRVRWRFKLREAWQYRHLLWMLALRDIKVLYAQTWIGLAWALLKPTLTVLLLSFVFGVVLDTPSAGVPHLLFTLCGLAGWTFFSTAISESGNSIVGAQELVKKIYFPRLIIPAAKLLPALLDLGIVLLGVVIGMAVYRVPAGPTLLALPFFLLFLWIAGFTFGLWLSALTIRYRDFRFITNFILRLGLYATPVAYSAEVVPAPYFRAYLLLPTTVLTEGLRWSILGVGQWHNEYLYSFFGTLVLLIFGLRYFFRVEKELADII